MKDDSGFEGIDDMFQIKVLEGQPVIACNICNEGFKQDYDIRKHIEEEHNERGGLHSVVSHKSVFGNQKIRQLEL